MTDTAVLRCRRAEIRIPQIKSVLPPSHVTLSAITRCVWFEDTPPHTSLSPHPTPTTLEGLIRMPFGPCVYVLISSYTSFKAYPK